MTKLAYHAAWCPMAPRTCRLQEQSLHPPRAATTVSGRLWQATGWRTYIGLQVLLLCLAQIEMLVWFRLGSHTDWSGVTRKWLVFHRLASARKSHCDREE